MSDPQTSCTTYLYTASIWQQSSLQADGQSLNQSRQQMLPLLDHKSHLSLRCKRGYLHTAHVSNYNYEIYEM